MKQLKWKDVVTKDGRDVVSINESERSVIGIISTNRVDGDREIVLPKGLDFSRHVKNPIVLHMHDPKHVVGKMLWHRVHDDRIESKTKFAKTGLAEETWQLYREGFMHGWSIGMDWDGMEREEVKSATLKQHPEWEGAEAVIKKAVILEYSAVSIPCNEDAVTRAKAKGMLGPESFLIKFGFPLDKYEKPCKVVETTKRIVRVVPTIPSVTALEIHEEVRQTMRFVRGII